MYFSNREWKGGLNNISKTIDILLHNCTHKTLTKEPHFISTKIFKSWLWCIGTVFGMRRWFSLLSANLGLGSLIHVTSASSQVVLWFGHESNPDIPPFYNQELAFTVRSICTRYCLSYKSRIRFLRKHFWNHTCSYETASKHA